MVALDVITSTYLPQAVAAMKHVWFELLHHPLYSLHLTPSDFCLFPKLKEYVRGCEHSDDEDIICTANGWLKEQDEQFWYNGMCALEKGWIKCILVAGDYVLFTYVRVFCVKLQTL